MKTVGHRKPVESPRAYLRRARTLQRYADRHNPWPRPRGFVFRARTWEEYERWKQRQENPRLW